MPARPKNAPVRINQRLVHLVEGEIPEMVHSYYPVELNTQEPATHADNVTLPVACYDLLLDPDEVRISHT